MNPYYEILKRIVLLIVLSVPPRDKYCEEDWIPEIEKEIRQYIS